MGKRRALLSSPATGGVVPRRRWCKVKSG